jgi:multiple sugar transport system permease protein
MTATATAVRRPRRVHPASVMLVLGVLLAAAAALLPIAIIVFTAFKPIAEVNAYPPTLVPGQWTLENFARIFEELPFARLILNSVVFAGGVTLFALVFDSLAAYALARIDFRGSRVLLIAPRAADAFGIFFLRQFFLSLPRDLDNAARIDGASEFRIFRSVILPNAVPALLTLGIFTFVNNWNDLLWPLVFTTDAEMGTITSGLTLLTGPGGIIPQGVMMAGSLIAVLPLAVMFLMIQRRFIESVATTGMK